MAFRAKGKIALEAYLFDLKLMTNLEFA